MAGQGAPASPPFKCFEFLDNWQDVREEVHDMQSTPCPALICLALLVPWVPSQSGQTPRVEAGIYAPDRVLQVELKMDPADWDRVRREKTAPSR